MTAKEKLSEAEYFFKKIINVYNSESEVLFNTSAFLSACKSIPDHLLQELNVKQGLGIQLTEFLGNKALRKKAQEHDDLYSLEVIDWHDKKIELFNKDPILSVMMAKRRLNVHHHMPKSLSIGITTTDTTFNPFKELELPPHFSKWRKLGLITEELEAKVIEIKEKWKTNSLPFKSTHLWHEWYFDDLQNTELTKACYLFFKSMKDFIFEADLLLGFYDDEYPNPEIEHREF